MVQAAGFLGAIEAEVKEKKGQTSSVTLDSFSPIP